MENQDWPVRCQECGWRESNQAINSGVPISVTGTFSEVRCPICDSTRVEEDDKTFTGNYLILARQQGHEVLQMGIQRDDPPEFKNWCWSVHWPTGQAGTASILDLEPFGYPEPLFQEVLLKIGLWARNGDSKAMWWLGSYHEVGCRTSGANGAKALAYYLAAIRREINSCDDSSIRRVLIEGFDDLFRDYRRADVANKTPHDVWSFLAKFGEFQMRDGKIRPRWPYSNDWQACIAIAEGLQ